MTQGTTHDRRGKRRTNSADGTSFQRTRKLERMVTLPWEVVESIAFISLSPLAVKLLLDLALQHDQNKSGHVCATWRWLATRNCPSERAVAKAIRELITNGLILEARKRQRPGTAALYRLGWYPTTGKGG